MKNTFRAAVSHELRSPLTSILGLSLTLERTTGLAEEDRHDLVSRLSANAQKLDRLHKDLCLARALARHRDRTLTRGSLRRAPRRARLGRRSARRRGIVPGVPSPNVSR